VSQVQGTTDSDRLQFLLGVYFRTQASIEKYMGREKLSTWTEHIAAITASEIKHTIPDRREQAKRLVTGLDTMLDVYGSDAELSEGQDEFKLDVHRCGIYDYRERAQQQGVELTLPTPCEFCVDLRSRTAAHLGIEVSSVLRDRGCTYVSHLPESAHGN
jgi:hypothetical protein